MVGRSWHGDHRIHNCRRGDLCYILLNVGDLCGILVDNQGRNVVLLVLLSDSALARLDGDLVHTGLHSNLLSNGYLRVLCLIPVISSRNILLQAGECLLPPGLVKLFSCLAKGLLLAGDNLACLGVKSLDQVIIHHGTLLVCRQTLVIRGVVPGGAHQTELQPERMPYTAYCLLVHAVAPSLPGCGMAEAPRGCIIGRSPVGGHVLRATQVFEEVLDHLVHEGVVRERHQGQLVLERTIILPL